MYTASELAKTFQEDSSRFEVDLSACIWKTVANTSALLTKKEMREKVRKGMLKDSSFGSSGLFLWLYLRFVVLGSDRIDREFRRVQKRYGHLKLK